MGTYDGLIFGKYWGAPYDKIPGGDLGIFLGPNIGTDDVK